MKLSVIVPIYNSQRYLKNCLNSILNQTFHDLEVIAINDGSTDHSLDILNSYSQRDKRIKIFNIKNSGVAYARNYGLIKSKGKYIAFCDSDDTVPIDAYNIMIKKAEKTRCDVVTGCYSERDDYGSINLYSFNKNQKDSDFYSFFMIPAIWNKLFRKEFIKKNKLQFDNLLVGEDVVFLARFFSCKPIKSIIFKNVYYYWKHNKNHICSLNHIYNLKYFEAHILCREMFLDICKKNKIKEGKDYVFLNLIHFLLEYIYKIPDINERNIAFDKLKKHISLYNWHNKEKLFESIFNIKYKDFIKLNSYTYFVNTELFNHKDIVIKQFKAGQIGFRYILRYTKEWLNYKIIWRNN